MSRKKHSKDLLQGLPGIGMNLAQHLREIGFSDPSELRNQDAEQMYAQLCEYHGRRIDRCVLYAFRCAVYYASNESHDPELLKWWNWKERAL
jgi:hypothetical protein